MYQEIPNTLLQVDSSAKISITSRSTQLFQPNCTPGVPYYSLQQDLSPQTNRAKNHFLAHIQPISLWNFNFNSLGSDVFLHESQSVLAWYSSKSIALRSLTLSSQSGLKGTRLVHRSRLVWMEETLSVVRSRTLIMSKRSIKMISIGNRDQIACQEACWDIEGHNCPLQTWSIFGLYLPIWWSFSLIIFQIVLSWLDQ